MTWQPIETAPKDGTLVDIWVTGKGRYTDCRWQEAWTATRGDGKTRPAGWLWLTGYDEYSEIFQPAAVSHWMPLPASPTGAP
jgi:hypothetical protein